MDLRNLPGVILLSSPMRYGNMSFVRGDFEQTLANRKRFLEGSGVKMNQIVAITSYHSGKVFVADKKDSGNYFENQGFRWSKTVVLDSLTYSRG